jgi:hypothetical protein
MADYSTKEILNSKKELDDSLVTFLKEYSNENITDSDVQSLVSDLLTKHISIINSINESVGKAHQKNDFFRNEDIKNDYLATVENFIETSLKIHDILKSIIKKHNLTDFTTGKNSYITIQKMVNTFSTKTNKEKIKNEFTNRNIPINGFNQKLKKVKGKYLRLQLFIGIPLLLLSIALIFLGEIYLGKPFNGIQLIILKALIALSISTVGSSLIEGNVETDWTLQKGLTIRAVGWVAVFLLIYFLNPASPGDVY